jgi:hypothetical protein
VRHELVEYLRRLELADLSLGAQSFVLEVYEEIIGLVGKGLEVLHPPLDISLAPRHQPSCTGPPRVDAPACSSSRCQLHTCDSCSGRQHAPWRELEKLRLRHGAEERQDEAKLTTN